MQIFKKYLKIYISQLYIDYKITGKKKFIIKLFVYKKPKKPCE